MAVITFWSNNEKTIGQTVSASVAATVMAMEKNYKILLIGVDIDNNTIENCFGSQQSNKNIIKNIVTVPQINLDTGVNGLIKIAKSNRVTPEMIKDYTRIIYKNRLEVLYSSTNKEFTIEEQIECYKTIILSAAKYYDYIFVDLKKGLRYQAVLDILDISDLIVLNTEQGINSLEEFSKTYETKRFYNTKLIWNICKYDKKSKYNTKNLTRTIWKKEPVFGIPYNTLLFEASLEGKVPELLLRIRTVKNDDECLELYNNAKRLVEGILLKQHDIQMKI